MLRCEITIVEMDSWCWRVFKIPTKTSHNECFNPKNRWRLPREIGHNFLIYIVWYYLIKIKHCVYVIWYTTLFQRGFRVVFNWLVTGQFISDIHQIAWVSRVHAFGCLLKRLAGFTTGYLLSMTSFVDIRRRLRNCTVFDKFLGF